MPVIAALVGGTMFLKYIYTGIYHTESVKRTNTFGSRSILIDTVMTKYVSYKHLSYEIVKKYHISSYAQYSYAFLPLDETIASRAVLVIVSRSDGRADGRTETPLEPDE